MDIPKSGHGRPALWNTARRIIVGYCLAVSKRFSPVKENLRNLYRFLVNTVFAAVDNDTGAAEAVGCEDVGQRAKGLLNDYGNAVLRLAYSYLHNKADAEEVLQDTLVQFLKTAPDLGAKEHEKAWFLHVAANLAKNRIKYNFIRKTDELLEELVTEERDDLTFVWEAVKKLPDRYREAIHLFYYEGYSTSEIARILKMKDATVRSNLARGREKLKAVLKEMYDFA